MAKNLCQFHGSYIQGDIYVMGFYQSSKLFEIDLDISVEQNLKNPNMAAKPVLIKHLRHGFLPIFKVI